MSTNSVDVNVCQFIDTVATEVWNKSFKMHYDCMANLRLFDSVFPQKLLTHKADAKAIDKLVLTTTVDSGFAAAIEKAVQILGASFKEMVESHLTVYLRKASICVENALNKVFSVCIAEGESITEVLIEGISKLVILKQLSRCSKMLSQHDPDMFVEHVFGRNCVFTTHVKPIICKI